MFEGAELRDASDRTTGGTYSAGFSLYIRSCKLRMQIVNVQNIMTTVWIYECVLRRDINVGDLDARVDWQEGIDAQGGDDTDFARPYSTPFTSRRFCTKWRVAKVTRAIVSPGETHVHYVHANVKHKLSSERYTNFDDGDGTGTVGIGGLSTCVMIVGLGGVWNDVTTKSAIGYSPVALDVTYTKKYDVMGTINDRKITMCQINYLLLLLGSYWKKSMLLQNHSRLLNLPLAAILAGCRGRRFFFYNNKLYFLSNCN